ncbi:hypothetical protein HW115_01230 [Verrucomicrobiaceae bacterium N1E253]|uniref:Tetratricopeptide repeat protein n=1 Tax=Oceaniferula marina TaxID=2748318 RepID=A0A851G9X0_9BACT|nr:hypothetical protein [Oceaniferula marina]NWK54216.1 hypothetical protein [Oceaniferula marina]
MKFILLFLTLLVISAVSAVTCAEESSSDAFVRANRLFDQANQESLVNPAEAKELYLESILLYQQLLDRQEFKSAELHTNLGNAYFFAGEHGYAVLNYQRALHMDPLQGEAKHNLQYARSLAIDELEESRSQKITRVLSFWHRWPFGLRLLIFGFAHFAVWGLLAAYLLRKIPKNGWTLAGVSAGAFLVLVFGSSLWVSYCAWDNDVDGVVVEREIVARHGNGYIYGNAFNSPLHAGTEFTILEERGDWCHVRLLDRKTCWLPQSAIRRVKED